MENDPVLPSWRDGPAKRAIVEFVAGATTPGASFIEVSDRIAAFDNDGTLWAEQPMPAQFDFVFRRWVGEVKADPALASIQPYKALVERDMAFFAGVGTQDPATIDTMLAAFARSWAGTTPDEFDAEVEEWLRTSRQPKFGVSYRELVYRPMRELIDYLDAHQFRVFVCSGGGRDFMRVFAEETWGVHKENVIGTASTYSYIDGRIIRGDQALGGLNFGPGKPEHIFAQTGRLPVFAGGNGDIDIEMLESSRFALVIRHDDDDREFAYTSGAERVLTRAEAAGWTVASIRDDWHRVFDADFSGGGAAHTITPEA